MATTSTDPFTTKPVDPTGPDPWDPNCPGCLSGIGPDPWDPNCPGCLSGIGPKDPYGPIEADDGTLAKA
jgi:hypothetical protein